MNYCFFRGRIANEPRIYVTANGKKMAKFSTTEVDDYNGERKYFYPNFTAFGTTAETVETHCHKGALVAIECKYKEGEYKNREGELIKDKFFIAYNVSVLMQPEDHYRAASEAPTVTDGGTKQVQQSFNTYTGEAPELNITSDDLPF